MGFLGKLFGRNKEDTEELEKKRVDQGGAFEAKPQTSYEAAGLTMELPPEEEEIVRVIAASIFAENQRDTKLRVKSIVKIDPEKEIVAVIAASIAAGEYPDKTFRLKKIEEVQ